MKIGIISDTHDHTERTKKAIKQMEGKGCKVLIHCGDFCAPFMIKEISGFSGEVHCCFGNTDDRFLSYKLAIGCNVNLHGDLGEIEIDNKKIAFVHLPLFGEGFAMLGRYDLVCYGHTHSSRKEKIGSTWLVNPGEIMGANPSYAVYDTETDEIDIIKLEGG